MIAAKSLLVVEGEKDAETARKLGLVATCNAGGAGKWREEYSEQLRGKRVSVIADADEPGRKHAQRVAASLAGKVETLKVLELPGAKDLTEWVGCGGTGQQLLALIDSVEARERPAVADTAAVETECPKIPTGGETKASCRGGSQATRLVSIAEKAELFRFRRAHGMLPLPVPAKGGTVSELNRFLNLPCDEDRALVYSWLIAALRPCGPYPILNLQGEQGDCEEHSE